MTTYKNSQVLESEQFLNESLIVEDVRWPRLCRKSPDAGATGKVLVRGNLVLDLPVKLNITLAELIGGMSKRVEKIRCEWEFGSPLVGGFVGQVAPIAADMGFEVHICCNVAVPTPKPIMTFLESGRFDTSRLVVIPGATPASIELQCIDGHVLMPRRGIDSAAQPRVEVGEVRHFDAILVNPGAKPTRIWMLDELKVGNGSGNVTVGIVARHDWTDDEFSRLPDDGGITWLYFNLKEAIEAAKWRGRSTSCPKNVAKILKERVPNSTRVVVTDGGNGAYMMTDGHEPQHVPTTKISNGRAAGAGDTLACVTTLASVCGLDDEKALRIGMIAAKRRVAGKSVITGLLRA